MTMTPPEHRPQSMSDAVEVAARAHHDAYERLAPTLGYETREATRVPWDDLKTDMRLLMVESEAEALSAIGLPELLSEVERLRGVAEAAQRFRDQPFAAQRRDLVTALAALESEI